MTHILLPAVPIATGNPRASNLPQPPGPSDQRSDPRSAAGRKVRSLEGPLAHVTEVAVDGAARVGPSAWEAGPSVTKVDNGTLKVLPYSQTQSG